MWCHGRMCVAYQPVLILHSCILHFLSVSGLEIFSHRLFGITAKSCSLTQFASRCCWPPPQVTEHCKVTNSQHLVHFYGTHDCQPNYLLQTIFQMPSMPWVNLDHVWLTSSQSSAFQWVQGFRLHASVLFGLSVVLQRWGAGQYTSRSLRPSPQLPEHWWKYKDLRQVYAFCRNNNTIIYY